MTKRSSMWALFLLLPVPSLGVWAGMIAWPDQGLGNGLFFLAKAWLFAFPLIWRLGIEKRPISWSRPTQGGFGLAIGLAVAISAFIVVAYMTVGKVLIDPKDIQAMGADTGLDRRSTYLVGALYWVTVNSVLEEYVWRWFVVEKLEDFLGSKTAIVCSALGFTLHHIVAMQIFLTPVVVVLAATGVFVGGAVWSWCFVRYRSIWPGYVSHAIVDVAVFAVGYHLLFMS
ncbi:MAG: CPBP family intramembrane metalloprotease [Planctomycetes bacterium]|nr:CPBP family intramembrane metalloprotease [Planctomycetota bacterium]